MKAVILAAGRGKRMKHLTDDTPKPLLKVGGKTFLDRIFDILPDIVDDVIVVIGYRGEKIKKYLGGEYKNKKVRYAVQKKLNGTGEAILLTQKYFTPKERFLILYADEVPTKKEIKECLNNDFSWLCHEVSDPSFSGVASLSKDGYIVEVIEKPTNISSNLAVGGVMVVNSDLFRYKPVRHRDGEYYLTSMMNKFIKSNAVKAVMGRKNLYSSTPEDIDRAR